MIRNKIKNFFRDFGFRIWTVEITDEETREIIGTVHFLFKSQAQRFCDKNEGNFLRHGYMLSYGGEHVFFFGLEVE